MAAAAAPAGSALGGHVERLVKRDHDGIRRVYEDFSKSKGTGNDEHRQRLAWQFIRDIAIHSLGEEEVLYPELKNRLGQSARDHALHEHAELKKILVELDGMSLKDAGYEAKMEHAYQVLDHHIREEEEKFLPELAANCAPQDLMDIGHRFASAKHHVPTRPHKLAPDKPATGNVVANILTMPLDAARDKVRWGTTEPPSAVLYDA